MSKKQAIKMVAFVLSMAVIFSFLNDLPAVNNKGDTLRIYGFYKEPENSIDVALIGASDIYKGYIAPLAYSEAGFTSYPVAVSAMPASLFLPVLRECERVQNPKLYVIEINGVFYGEEKQNRESLLREWFDNTPMSEVKRTGIESLIPEDEQDSYFFKFMKYHGNWNNLKTCISIYSEKKKIDENGYTYMKGYVAKNTISPSDPDMEMTSREMTEAGEKYLRELLQYISDENIDNVLFVRWPHRNKYEVEGAYDYIESVIAEYGYDFVNFTESMDEIGIDKETDFSDNEHLNPSGAKKMTIYFADYISKNYDVVQEHTEKVTAEWEDCAQKADEMIEMCIELTQMNENGSYWKNSSYEKLLEK